MNNSYNICCHVVNIMDEFLSFDEFRFVKDVGQWCNMCTKQQTC